MGLFRVLVPGGIHDWVLITPDGPRYWPQIDQELGAYS
jgi:triacylglycerol lipase